MPKRSISELTAGDDAQEPAPQRPRAEQEAAGVPRGAAQTAGAPAGDPEVPAATTEAPAGNSEVPALAAEGELSVGSFIDEEEEEEAEHRRMSALLKQFTPEQLRRYEHFRRSHFKRRTVMRVMQSISSYKVTTDVGIAVGGVAKMFAGEIVETARMVMEERDEQGPVHPRHVREALRRMRNAGRLPQCGGGGITRGTVLRR